MKLYTLFIFSLLLSSCGQSTKTETENDEKLTPSSQTEKVRATTTEFEIDDLKGKVFEIGNKTHFTDTCASHSPGCVSTTSRLPIRYSNVTHK